MFYSGALKMQQSVALCRNQDGRSWRKPLLTDYENSPMNGSITHGPAANASMTGIRAGQSSLMLRHTTNTVNPIRPEVQPACGHF
jgi:hypothetical protein